MAVYNEHTEVIECPVLPLRGAVSFPGVPLSVEIERKISLKAFDEACKNNLPILLLTQKKIIDPAPSAEDFFDVGTVCRVKQYVRLANGNVRLIADGIARAEVLSLTKSRSKEGAWHSKCVLKRILCEENTEIKAVRAEAEIALEEYASVVSDLSPKLLAELVSVNDIGEYADIVAANLFVDYEAKMKVLKETDPEQRLIGVIATIKEYTEIAKLQSSINKKVRSRMDRNQKEYYLSEQLKVIRSEMGEDAESDPDIDVYKEKISAAELPEEVQSKLMKEASKLSRMPQNSAEYGVICNYLDTCLELPWNKKTKDRVDLTAAERILERDHEGLEKVKERILEYLAVRKLAPKLRNQIICLAGPPGTGKTSVARSVAEAMKRKYVRVSLGGIRDEADIRGHRKTYIGSMPGRIIEGIRRAGTKNPVMLLDEIDKLTHDAHGDPSSALMEVLDSEQNKEFRDHFIELPFDLSDVLFIATANNLDTIPAPLRDRMEIITLKSYSLNEKLSIAKKHLIPKQLEKHGLSKKNFKITNPALTELINGYTHEAGVRNLEREIASLCRKAAKRLVEDPSCEKVEINVNELAEFLGPKKVIPETIDDTDEVGVVNGLAYTELGGALLKVEVAAMPGSGKLELTGSLGNVMKESAKTALTYIRSHSSEWDIPSDFYKKKDIHVHFPEGAVPKDGPSAGVTVVTALVSELSGRPVKNTVAMTGEVTLRGKVLPIGGLKEKTMAAYKAGVKTVLYPKDNEKELSEVDKTVREKLEFIPCANVSDVLGYALISK